MGGEKKSFINVKIVNLEKRPMNIYMIKFTTITTNKTVSINTIHPKKLLATIIPLSHIMKVVLL